MNISRPNKVYYLVDNDSSDQSSVNSSEEEENEEVRTPQSEYITPTRPIKSLRRLSERQSIVLLTPAVTRELRSASKNKLSTATTTTAVNVPTPAFITRRHR